MLKNSLFWVLHPKSLRRTYIYYMLSLVRHALKSKVLDEFEWDKNIQFHAGELSQLIASKKKHIFDTAYVPYLLGVQNGIEKVPDIVNFMKQLSQLVPKGHLLINPSRNMKEFYIAGQRYFITTGHSSIDAIPGLNVQLIAEDKYWFRTQGLTVFGSP